MVLSANEQSCKMYKASGAFCVFLVLEGVKSSKSFSYSASEDLQQTLQANF